MFNSLNGKVLCALVVAVGLCALVIVTAYPEVRVQVKEYVTIILIRR